MNSENQDTPRLDIMFMLIGAVFLSACVTLPSAPELAIKILVGGMTVLMVVYAVVKP